MKCTVCHDLKVMSLKLDRVKLGVPSTFVSVVLNPQISRIKTLITLQYILAHYISTLPTTSINCSLVNCLEIKPTVLRSLAIRLQYLLTPV